MLLRNPAIDYKSQLTKLSLSLAPHHTNTLAVHDGEALGRVFIKLSAASLHFHKASGRSLNTPSNIASPRAALVNQHTQARARNLPIAETHVIGMAELGQPLRLLLSLPKWPCSTPS